MEKSKLIDLISEKVNRSLPSFYRRLGLDNGYIYIMSVQTDGGDVTCIVAKLTDELLKEMENKYLEYLLDTDIEIAEWIESYIQHAGIRIRSTMWG